jgi:hypothetical protein
VSLHICLSHIKTKKPSTSQFGQLKTIIENFAIRYPQNFPSDNVEGKRVNKSPFIALVPRYTTIFPITESLAHYTTLPTPNCPTVQQVQTGERGQRRTSHPAKWKKGH